MSAMGHFRQNPAVRAMSAMPLIATGKRTQLMSVPCQKRRAVWSWFARREIALLRRRNFDANAIMSQVSMHGQRRTVRTHSPREALDAHIHLLLELDRPRR